MICFLLAFVSIFRTFLPFMSLHFEAHLTQSGYFYDLDNSAAQMQWYCHVTKSRAILYVFFLVFSNKLLVASQWPCCVLSVSSSCSAVNLGKWISTNLALYIYSSIRACFLHFSSIEMWRPWQVLSPVTSGLGYANAKPLTIWQKEMEHSEWSSHSVTLWETVHAHACSEWLTDWRTHTDIHTHAHSVCACDREREKNKDIFSKDSTSF